MRRHVNGRGREWNGGAWQVAGGLVLVLYFASSPLDGLLQVYGLGAVGPLVVGSMILASSLIALRARLDRRVLSALPLVVLVWWSAVTVLWSQVPSVAVRALVLQTYLVLPVVFALACPLPPAWRRLSLAAFSAGVCAAVIYGAYVLVSLGGQRWAGRLSVSDDYNPSWLAAQAGLVVLLSACALTGSSRSPRPLLWSAAGTVAFLGLLATQGRNALIALIGALLIVFGPRLHAGAVKFLSHGWVERERIRRTSLGMLMVAVLSGLTLALFLEVASRFPGIISFERIAGLFSGDAELATAGRTAVWAEYLSILARSHIWLVGAGIWSAGEIHLAFEGSAVPPHNVFISLLVELGLPGLFLYLMNFVALGRVALRVAEPHGVAAQGVLAYSFLLGFGNDVLTYKYFWLGLTLFAVLSAPRSPTRERDRDAVGSALSPSAS
jgi:O-antigen ligase